ncbi:hypothetical protein L1987_32569 [Smallanthus sonchifolius]|uniref:Uncharacterized protein n=1 Tax=Smallanthus sonchifolius TaxID=185202 RepID=A0ACB9HPS3_9ASTR|nr:hypothetical protein L1987_32569 [Smallanthus sonchifolius]
MAAPNGSHQNWADQVPIAVAPLNCVPYTGPPLDSDMAQQNEVNSLLENQPAMIYLPEQPTEKEMNDIMSASTHGVLVTGSAASGIIGPLMGSFDLSESDDSLLFRVALPGVSNDEKFKCEIQADGRIKIQGVTNTGEKKVHANNMVFEMHTQNLCPPGDFAVTFHLPANVDASTLKHVLDNGVLEGVVKKKPVQALLPLLNLFWDDGVVIIKLALFLQVSIGSVMGELVMAVSFDLQTFILGARVLKLYRQALSIAKRAPAHNKEMKRKRIMMNTQQIHELSTLSRANIVIFAMNVHQHEQTIEQELNDIMSSTKHGVLFSGRVTSGIIGPLMGPFNLSQFDDGFLFHVALLGVNNDESTNHRVLFSGSVASGIIGPLMGPFNLSQFDDGFLFHDALLGVNNDESLPETNTSCVVTDIMSFGSCLWVSTTMNIINSVEFKCEIQAGGTIKIQGVTNTGEKKVHAHNMVFEMHTQNLCLHADFSVTFHLPANVNPSTLKHLLDNGVLKGVVKKKTSQRFMVAVLMYIAIKDCNDFERHLRFDFNLTRPENENGSLHNRHCRPQIFRGELVMAVSLDLQAFILRARVLKLYRQALRVAKRAPAHSKGELMQTIRLEMEKNRDCNDKQRIRYLISEGTERLKGLDEMLDMQGY